MNAKLNNVSLQITKEDLIGRRRDFNRWDSILIGDMFYEFSVMNALVIMLRKACKAKKTVVLSEPCGILRAYTMTNELKQVAKYNLTDLSQDILGYRTTFVYRFTCQTWH